MEDRHDVWEGDQRIDDRDEEEMMLFETVWGAGGAPALLPALTEQDIFGEGVHCLSPQPSTSRNDSIIFRRLPTQQYHDTLISEVSKTVEQSTSDVVVNLPHHTKYSTKFRRVKTFTDISTRDSRVVEQVSSDVCSSNIEFVSVDQCNFSYGPIVESDKNIPLGVNVSLPGNICATSPTDSIISLSSLTTDVSRSCNSSRCSIDPPSQLDTPVYRRSISSCTEPPPYTRCSSRSSIEPNFYPRCSSRSSIEPPPYPRSSSTCSFDRPASVDIQTYPRSASSSRCSVDRPASVECPQSQMSVASSRCSVEPPSSVEPIGSVDSERLSEVVAGPSGSGEKRLLSENDKESDVESSSDDEDGGKILVPTNPLEWKAADIESWLRWSRKQWRLRPRPDASKFPATGKELLDLKGADLVEAAGSRKSARLLRKHLQHLRLSATGKQPSESDSESEEDETQKPKVSDDSYRSFTRQYLHDVVRKSSQKYFDDKLKGLEDELLILTKCPSTKLCEFRQVMKSFKTVYKRHWQACKGTDKRFQEKNSEWLSETIELPCASTPLAASSKGRPSKDFGECSERTKRRKTMEIRKNVPVDELTFAAEMSNRAAGNLDAAKIMHEIQQSPSRASKFRKAAQKTAITKAHSPEEALKIFVDANLTTAQYQIIQKANKEIYPCYTLLQKAKKDIFPKKTVSETEAEIKLQDLVDNTSSRLCKYLNEVLDCCSGIEKSNLTLSYKWGCDGSQQAQYKQKFLNDEDSDANVFISSLVPLRLTSGAKVLWQNPTPSSPRFCRPIRIRYTKENNDVTNEEIDYIEGQARELQPTCVGNGVKIMHILFPTMVDGKVCNAATHTTSTLRCYICGRTQKSFNDLTTTDIENPETFKFGISLLHARIRFFEFLLHLSYKLKANAHKGRLNKTDKQSIQTAKESIQKSFKEKTGLLVDFPKVGFGNTNDGNTSRRFFSDTEVAAEITGIRKELIERFRIILEVLSSGFEIDTEKFGVYTFETAKIYVDLYPWQPMSPTVHKILLHSPSVIKHALLPIGQLSEEASEARNKHFRKYRENYSRKFSRTMCLEDVTNRLLLTSDPYISSIRSAGYRVQNKKTMSEDAIKFLRPSAAFTESEDEDD